MNTNEPIYRQLIRQVKDSVLAGSLIQGQQVDSLQQVSNSWSVNPLTVQKAYRELELEGILELRRGRGYFIRDTAHQQLFSQERREFLKEQLPDCVRRAKWLGISWDEIQKAWSDNDLDQKPE
jgi:GntR family transcriptional regulator